MENTTSTLSTTTRLMETDTRLLLLFPDDDNNDDENTRQIINDQTLFIIKGVFNAVLTQGFCVLGSITNVINMIVFYKMGFSDTINITLMALAVSDFGACFVLIWRNIALNPWFQQLEGLPFETNEISYMISLMPHNILVNETKLLTAFISIERCLCVTMPLKVKSIITSKVVKLYCIISYVLSIVPYVPIYITHKYAWKFSPLRNRTLYGLVFAKNVVEVNNVIYPILNVVYAVLPFMIITIASIFLVVALRKNSKWRQKATSAEVSKASSKENKISKMVLTISVLFIACFLPFAVSLPVQLTIDGLSIGGKYGNEFIMMGAVVFFFEVVNSACNIFIYYTNSTVYRTTFNKTFRMFLQKNTEKGAPVV